MRTSFSITNLQVEKIQLQTYPLSSPPSFSTLHNSSDLGLSTDHEEGFEKGVLCIQESVQSKHGVHGSQLSLPICAQPSLLRSYSANSLGSNNIAPFPQSNDFEVSYTDSQRSGGWFDGLLLCLRPVFYSMLGKSNSRGLKEADGWEIPFEHIRDLQWLGSGAQGAVFRGHLYDEVVAVKKVREKLETDMKLLRKLSHPNIVMIKGVCNDSPGTTCIVMEYCPFGTLYDYLRTGTNVPPTTFVKWAWQVADGMNFLHTNKIIHRDLKSANVLIGHSEILKISDFGTCRQWNDISVKMSFAGTVAWMAPEIIRSECCSEKVDIWSFGVVLWELLTCETPYKNVDSSAIIWGVGNNTLHLPIPSTCPEGFKLLLKICWNPKPRNRPSFRHILTHIKLSEIEITSTPEEEYYQAQATWKVEISHYMENFKNDSQYGLRLADELVKKRQEELRHAQDIRDHYEKKLERANDLYMELTACLLQVEQREQILSKKEQKLQAESKSASRFGSKRIVRPFLKYHERFSRKQSPVVQNQPNGSGKPVEAFANSVGCSAYHASAKSRIRRVRYCRNCSRNIDRLNASSNPDSVSSNRRSLSRDSPRLVDHSTQTEVDVVSPNNNSVAVTLCPSKAESDVKKAKDLNLDNQTVNENCCDSKNSSLRELSLQSRALASELKNCSDNKEICDCGSECKVTKNLTSDDDSNMNSNLRINKSSSFSDLDVPEGNDVFHSIDSETNISEVLQVPTLNGIMRKRDISRCSVICSQASTSSEEEVDSEDEIPHNSRCLRSVTNNSSEQSYSSEGILSEEENTSECSSSQYTHELLSSLSNPDILDSIERSCGLKDDKNSKAHVNIVEIDSAAVNVEIVDKLQTENHSSSNIPLPATSVPKPSDSENWCDAPKPSVYPGTTGSCQTTV